MNTVMIRVRESERERINAIRRYLSAIRSRDIPSDTVISEAIDTYIAANPDIAVEVATQAVQR